MFYYDSSTIKSKLGDSVKERVNIISELKNTVNILSNTPHNELTAEQMRFIIEDLPPIFSYLYELEKSKQISSEVELFAQEYITLTVYLNFQIDLVRVIYNILEDIKEPVIKYEVSRSSKSLSKRNLHHILSPEASGIKLSISNLIPHLFTTNFFESVLANMENCKFDDEQFFVILGIYSCIENYISFDLKSIILPKLINFITTEIIPNRDSYIAEHCEFLKTHFSFDKTKDNDIVKAIVEASGKGTDEKRKLKVIEIILEIIDSNDKNVLEFKEEIKKKAIEVIGETNLTFLLDKLYKLLDKLADMDTDYEVDEIIKIINHSKGGIPSKILLKLISKVKQSLNPLADYFISNNDIFYPDVILSLISKVGRKGSTLFRHLLLKTDKPREYNLSEFKSNKEFESILENVLDSVFDEDGDSTLVSFEYNQLESLCYIFLGLPDNPFFDEFVNKLFRAVISNPVYTPLLDKFSSVMKNSKLRRLLMDVLDYFFTLFDKVEISAFQHVIPVMKEWMTYIDDFPVSNTIQKMRNIDLRKMPPILPAFLDVFFSKADDKKEIVNFLLDVISESVPRKYARWFVQNLYSTSGDVHGIENAIDRFLSNGSNSSLDILYQIVLYEADFFRLGEEFGLSQSICIKDDDKVYKVSLCPLHSSRRLYAEISMKTSRKLNSFQLWVNEDSEEFFIPYGGPLTNLRISGDTPLKLQISETNNGAPENIPESTLLNYMNTNEKLTKLMNILSKSENEDLFNAATVFDGLLPDVELELSKVLCSKHQDPLKFVSIMSTRVVFPWALRSYCLNGHVDPEVIVKALEALYDYSYDIVSLALALHSIKLCVLNIELSSELIYKCVISSPEKVFRQTVKDIVSKSDQSKFISILPETVKKENRHRTREYFEIIMTFDVDPSVLTSIFYDLDQFEYADNWDIDETFICLTEVIPHDEKTINCVMERLFSPPSVDCQNLPFLQTAESRTAAYKFLDSDRCYSYILKKLGNLTSTPTVAQLFSDNFSCNGRIGLINQGTTCYINAILQIFNAMPNFTSKLFELETLTPKMESLRSILLKLRFGRGQDLSTTPLTNHIEGFNPKEQKDAEEFFSEIINTITEQVSYSESQPIRCTIVNEFRDKETGELYSSNEEHPFTISLPIKGFSNLYEAFRGFERGDEIANYRTQDKRKVNVIKTTKIALWPDYLIIHLKRWEVIYTMNDVKKEKLSDNFQFPVNFKPENSSISFDLIGVVVHEGNSESGHYTSIIHDTDENWYFCNDIEIQNFDRTNLASWCFGGIPKDKDSSIWTGYILFYRKRGITEQEIKMPPQLEKEVNDYNRRQSNHIYFFSYQYTSYVENMFLNGELTKEKLAIIFTTLFRIVCVNEETLKKWATYLPQYVLINRENCYMFFEFCRDILGANLHTLFKISESVSNNMSIIINRAFEKVTDSTEPTKILVHGFENSSHKRGFIQLLETINYACKMLEVDWRKEGELLLLMTSFIASDKFKDVFRTTIDQRIEAFDSLSKVLSMVVRVPECANAVKTLLDVTFLEKIDNHINDCYDFIVFLNHLSSFRPQFLESLVDLKSEIRDKINYHMDFPIIGKDSESNFDISFDFRFYIQKAGMLIFSEEEEDRTTTAYIFDGLLGKEDPSIQKYAAEYIQNHSASRPEFDGSSSYIAVILSYIPMCLQIIGTSFTRCVNYLELFPKIAFSSPKYLSYLFPEYFDKIIHITSETEILTILLTTLHHLLLFNTKFIDCLLESSVNFIKNLELFNTDIVEIIIMRPDIFADCKLTTFCISSILKEKISCIVIDRLLKLVEEGKINTGPISFPDNYASIWSLKITNRLFHCNVPNKDELIYFMKCILNRSRSLTFFTKSKPFREAEKLVSTFC